MKTTIKLAVASALVAVASSANAGIVIPAGDWTLDIGGVVNAYYTSTSFSGDDAAAGEYKNGNTVNNITTGLLPNYLSVSGKTRQNDLDVGFTISINPGASTKQAGIQSAQQENRQAFLTFGDKSWGSIKLGKDLGIYASDAILNDQTLLGVGSAAGGLAGNTTTLGRIGRGFMYADWKSQVAYSSPNWNGFSFTVGVTQAWNALNSLDTASTTTAGQFTAVSGAGASQRGGSSPAFEGKASYEWAGDVAGKVWVSGISQKVEGLSRNGIGAAAATALSDDRATAMDIGANVNVAGFGLTGYYGQGDGIGQTVQLLNGFDQNGKSRDSDQWYVQGSYTIPGVGTKLAASYGESTLDGNSVDGFSDIENNMWVVGAYHPLTKHLNLVAEYSQAKDEVNNRTGADTDLKAKTISLGAILFF
ncbi:MAG: porin [Methylotenera sp.]|nr:porin [Methylotenera sp.]MDP1755471.1 porin [Methylotenera sp.]MDP1960312.1 porin [Methylotenera sp.]MDP2402851.1 porin [Methylotenera sp.]MDP3095871.1 porin [Methylotenera sp.]